MIAATTLIDSGCTGNCINSGFVTARNLATKKIMCPILIYGADGTPSASRTISEYVEMEMHVNDHREHITLAIMDLSKEDIFLGHEWLQYHNPDIDWRRGRIAFNDCPDECFPSIHQCYLDPEEDYGDETIQAPGGNDDIMDTEDRLLFLQVNVNAAWTPTQRLAEEASMKE